MIRSILENFVHKPETSEDEFEAGSLAFAGQPVEKQIPIASYDARYNPGEKESPSVFDINTLKPGAIMRINMGGYPRVDMLGEPYTDVTIYSYVVAGKRNHDGIL